MLADAVIINISIVLAYLVRFNFALPAFNFQPYLEMSVWITLGAVFFFHAYHLYSISARTKWDDQFYSVILAVTLTLMLSISLTYISANYSFPRSVFLLSWVLQIMFMLLWRYFLWKLSKRVLGVQKAVLIGDKQDAATLADELKKFPESHIEIAGLIVTENKPVDRVEKYEVLGDLTNYESILANTDLYDVAVITPSLPITIKEKIVCSCYNYGKEALLVPDLYEVLLIRANLDLIDDIPLFSVKDTNGNNDPVKRCLDVVLGSIGLIIALPIMAVLAVIIKLDSPGPIIYRQERVTKGGRVFTLYKFRTMVEDAEATTGPVFAMEDDQRATRVGKFLRKSRLDELPQLINVIKGDMSLVGPRPERPVFVERFSKEINGYDHRHRMKPGLTGVAQVAGKYDTGPREKLIFDLLYAKRNGILVDIQILLNTVKVLFMRDKAL